METTANYSPYGSTPGDPYEYYYDEKNFPSPSPTPSPRGFSYYFNPSPPVRPATRAHFRGQSTSGFNNPYLSPQGPSFSPRYTSDGQYATANGSPYFDREAGGFATPRYEPERKLPTPSHARRSSSSVPQRPQTARPASSNIYKRPAPGPKRQATEADAKRHRIPVGYSLKHWDPSEEPETPKRQDSSSRSPSSTIGTVIRSFSSGREERYVEGYVHNTLVEGFPDNGADVSFISPQLATKLGLTPDEQEQRDIELPSRHSITSPGVVRVPWVFKGESTLSTISCWIFPGLVHDLVLGKPFLAISKTLTTFKHRIKSRLKASLSRLRLMLLGHEQQRLCGLFNGQPTLALPDTGSDIMLVSRDYAQKCDLEVDWGEKNHHELEYADGSIGRTSGVARDVEWTVGSSTILCDFYVLDDLRVDVLLSSDYLFGMDVFSAQAEQFFELESEDRVFFYNIRLVNKVSGQVESVQLAVDVTSPNAFGPSMMQQEWATRDRVRDEIDALPRDQQPSARQAEAKRQRRWEELRKAHQLRWKSLPQAPALVSSGQVPSSQGASSVGATTPSGRREKWRKRIRIPFLRRA